MKTIVVNCSEVNLVYPPDTMSPSKFHPNQLIFWAFLALSVTVEQNVLARPITFQFDGELDDVDTALSSSFSVGDRYSGLYTFDATVLDNYGDTEFGGFALFDEAISAMTFTTNNYSASATSGSITHDFEDTFYYSVRFYPLSGHALNGLAVDSMALSWNLSSIDTLVTPSPTPNFDPTLPIYLIDPFQNYFSADGQLVFDNFLGLVGNPDQPLYYKNGDPVPPESNGYFRLTFSKDGEYSSIVGRLSSVVVVPTPTTALEDFSDA